MEYMGRLAEAFAKAINLILVLDIYFNYEMKELYFITT
jgi:hypothetical protein